MKNKQLLCTFTNSKEYDAVILEIKNFYSVINGKIFLLCNVNNPKELYATYNVGGGVGVGVQVWRCGFQKVHIKTVI